MTRHHHDVRPRQFVRISILVLITLGVAIAPQLPHPVAQAQQTSTGGLSFSANGKRYRVDFDASGTTATQVEIGNAPPSGAIFGPDGKAYWIEQEPVVWIGDLEPEPQVWRIMRGARDGSSPQVALLSATFYASATARANASFPYNTAPRQLSMSANGAAIYFDPCRQTTTYLSCSAMAFNLQSGQIADLKMGGSGQVAVAPDGQRAFLTFPGSCSMGGRYYHTYLATPTQTITLGTGMPGQIAWLSDGRLLFSMVDVWTCDNQAETNRIRLAAATGLKIRDLALNVFPDALVAAPDELRAAYLVSVYDSQGLKTSQELWVVGLDGTGQRKLLDLPADASGLLWEPISSPPPAERRPLVFVHGIMGSTLYKKDDEGVIAQDETWPGQPLTCTNHLDLELGKHEFDALDAIRRVVSNNSLCTPPGAIKFDVDVYDTFLNALRNENDDYKEYQINRDPNRRTLAGCDHTQSDANLFVFAYDWRQSNADSADALGEFMECIYALHPDADGVDVITHSMGGLVARRYLLDVRSLSAQEQAGLLPVRRLITIAAPWLGAPRAIDILFSGIYPPFATADLWGNYGLMTPDELKQISRTFPGAHELTPSRTYFERYPALQVQEMGWDFDGDGTSTEPLSYDELTVSLDRQFGNATGSNGASFHTPDQDDWNASAGDIQYYHIVGIAPGRRTINTLQATATIVCKNRPRCSEYEHREQLLPLLDYGDGTVPIESARRTDVGSGYYEVRQAEGDEVADHTAIMHNPIVIACVRSILAGTPSCSRLAARAASAPQLSGSADDQSLYVYVSGVASLAVSDSAGHVSNTDGDTPPPDPLPGAVPAIDIYHSGVNSFVVVLPATETYTLTVRASESPVTIDARLDDGTAVSQAVRYRDLPLGAGTAATMTMSGQSFGPLRHDSDGDGSFEQEIPPTAAVSGPQADDTEGPVISIQQSGPLTRSTITLRAADPSGVERMLYSIDGQQFIPYTAPFVVDAAAHPTLQAFADDAIANRSGLYTYQLITRQYIPLLRR